MPVLSLRPRTQALRPFVTSLSYCESDLPPARERILPTGRVHLLINLHEDEICTYDARTGAAIQRTHGVVLEGPASHARIIDTRVQRRILSIDFTLGGAAPFFPLGETHDDLVELDQLWGRNARLLRERLLEASTPTAMLALLESALLERFTGTQIPDAAIPAAAAAFEGGARVKAVASELGLGSKTFVRRFRDATGLTPKRFSRVRRIQRLVASVGSVDEIDWSRAALEHGYTDQAHLVHDFRDLTGLTPTAYHPRSAAEPNHVPVAGA